MRVLHVFDHSLPLHSGYSFRSRALIREQRRLGWETFHLTTPRHTASGPDPEAVDGGLSFYRTPPPPPPLPIFGAREIAEIRATAARLDQLVADLRPDVLHAHSPALTAAAALLVRRRRNIPVVYEIRAVWEDAAVANGTATMGGLRYRATRFIETFVARQADAVCCICDGLRQEYLERGVPGDRIFIIPNAVDLDQFGASTPRDAVLSARLGLDNADVVGFLGSFYEYEGIDLLVEALALIASRRPRLKLLLVGGGPSASKVSALIAARNLKDRVVMIGRVPQAEINKYYALVDVLAFPRLKSRLTDIVTPLKPLEAMALQKVVAASDVGGHRELIEDGQTGHLFEAGSASALADALDRVFVASAGWPALRARALQYVTDERTWARSVANYVGAYHKARAHRLGS